MSQPSLTTFQELTDFAQELIDKGISIPENFELTAYISHKEYIDMKSDLDNSGDFFHISKGERVNIIIELNE